MKIQKKRILVVFIILVFVLFLFVIKTKKESFDPNKITVVTSFYPLYYFSGEIGGDRINLYNLTPTGTEPHDYEPSTSDIVTVEKSNLLILNGVIEPWSSKLIQTLKNKQIKIIEAGQGLMHVNGFEEENKSADPHVWLDPVLAKSEAMKILDGFVSVDPANKNYYIENANRLFTNLDNLDGEFKQGLSSCKQKTIVTSHNAFGYIADRYGLKQISVSGLSPEAEASPKDLVSIVNTIKKNDVKYVFFEKLISPKLAQTLSSETGAKMLLFDPLEGLTPDELSRGDDYMSIQRQNLLNLKIALQCN